MFVFFICLPKPGKDINLQTRLLATVYSLFKFIQFFYVALEIYEIFVLFCFTDIFEHLLCIYTSVAAYFNKIPEGKTKTIAFKDKKKIAIDCFLMKSFVQSIINRRNYRLYYFLFYGTQGTSAIANVHTIISKNTFFFL